MLFEWDSKKAALNIKKHRISFQIACTIFNDPLHLSIVDLDTTSEERWITMGRAINNVLLVVVHTYKHRHAKVDIIRIISARKASKKEKIDYEEGV